MVQNILYLLYEALVKLLIYKQEAQTLRWPLKYNPYIIHGIIKLHSSEHFLKGYFVCNTLNLVFYTPISTFMPSWSIGCSLVFTDEPR